VRVAAFMQKNLVIIIQSFELISEVMCGGVLMCIKRYIPGTGQKTDPDKLMDF
jgi:hypothetical protein